MELFRYANQHFHSSKIRRRIGLLLATSVLLISVACSKKASPENRPMPPPPTTEEVMALYDLYRQGNYQACVEAMASCEGKPATYRKEMEWMLKQHADNKKKETGGITQARLSRITLHDNGNMANVFLNITYKDNTTEEIIWQLVYVHDKWRLR